MHFVLLQERLKIEHALGQQHIVSDVARQCARGKGLGLLGQHRDLHMRQGMVLEMFEQANMGWPHTPQNQMLGPAVGPGGQMGAQGHRFFTRDHRVCGGCR